MVQPITQRALVEDVSVLEGSVSSIENITNNIEFNVTNQRVRISDQTATQNKAVTIGIGATDGSSAVTIGTTANGNPYGISIGRAAGSAGATGNNAISIGNNANPASSSPAGTNSIAIGNFSSCSGNNSIAIGVGPGTANCVTSADNAIQLGYGTNSTSKTFNVGFYDASTPVNYTLLDSLGEIPTARYKAFTGADGVNAGVKGVVPAPTATDNDKFLRGDGTWATAGGGASSLTDLAGAGDGISFATTKDNYTIPYSQTPPTVTNGVATGFASVPLEFYSPFRSTTYTSCEIGIKLTYVAGQAPYQMPLGSGSICYFWVGSGTSQYAGAVYAYCRLADNTTVQLGSSAGYYTDNSTHYLKLTFNTTDGYALLDSTDGVTYTTIATNTTKLSPLATWNTMATIGQAGGSSAYYWNGSVDLKNTYVKIDNVEVWRGIQTFDKPQITAALHNLAYSDTAFTLLGNPSPAPYAFNIGPGSKATGQMGVAIGPYTTASNTRGVAVGYATAVSGYYGTAVGQSANASAQNATGIGSGALASATYAIQLGAGTNSTANSLSVGLDSGSNYQLLDSAGIIPSARMPSDVLKNTSTGTDSLYAGTVANSLTGFTGFGVNSQGANYAVSIGLSAKVGYGAVSLGMEAQSGSGSNYAVCLGWKAKVDASCPYAIQLGTGTNSTANSLSVGLDASKNYTLLTSDGTIPGPRMSLQGSAAPDTTTVGSVGQFYVDTTNQDAYICVSDASSTYTWKKITP